MFIHTHTDEVLWAFSNWTNRTREGLLEFVELWFDPVGSDINDWIPTDWQERYTLSFNYACGPITHLIDPSSLKLFKIMSIKNGQWN